MNANKFYRTPINLKGTIESGEDAGDPEESNPTAF